LRIGFHFPWRNTVTRQLAHIFCTVANAIIGFEPGDDAAKVGLDPAKAIWIVAMKGNVEWSGPGRQIGGSGNEFDNISIALDVNTLEYIGAFAAGPDERLPLGLQR
jgi:hypothetical protein